MARKEVELDWPSEHRRLWKQLVPPKGQADTVDGEVIRITGKLTDEAYRNGNQNWSKDHEAMWMYLGETLDDEAVFTTAQRVKIRHAIARIIQEYERPDTGDTSPYYFVTEMAVRWCLAHDKPRPREGRALYRL